jgi:plastocyanin
MSRDDRSILGWGAFVVAIAALFVAMFGLRDSGGESASGSTGGGGASAAATRVRIEMSEFAFTPSMPEIPAGPVVLEVANVGSMVHNLSIPSLGLKTPDIQPGDSVELDLGNVAPGEADFLCEIAGHAASGMTGKLSFVAGGGESAGGDMGGGEGSMDDVSWQEMDRMMEEVAFQFPAKTEKVGGKLMEPTILADGTKQFEVTAENVKWEVTPGKFVDAMAYNGVVPGPEIQVEVGDKVRFVFTNKMDESTSVHFHGIRVPALMDGVDPYTQHAVEPGETFVYEFTTLEPAVGMYHSHHNAMNQIPDGLFGTFLVGEMPIPEMLQDMGYTEITKQVTMTLNDAGVIGLSLNGKGFPATEPYTLKVGEVMLVHYQNEGLTAHPMHLHQPTGWIIAKDGVPLPSPIPGDTINVAPGERYTVLYKAEDPGVWAWHCHILSHAEGPEGMFGMVTALIVTR